MRSLVRARRHTALASLAVSLTAACSDRDTSITPPTANRLVASAAVAADTGWDTFVADITMVPTRVDGSGRRRQFPETKYTVERTRHPSGWSTVITYAPRIRARMSAIPDGFDPEARELSRIKVDERGRVTKFRMPVFPEGLSFAGASVENPGTGRRARLRT